MNEDPGSQPEHRAGMELAALEARLDYMGSSVLMGRTNQFKVDLKDEWRVQPSGADSASGCR